MAPAPDATNKKQTGKSRKKKQRISKHVIKAREDQAKNTQEMSSDPAVTIPSISTNSGKNVSAKPTSDKKQKKKRKGKHIKDPSDVMSYLTGWKHRTVEGAWKFNKNTQSWLIRHMYEPDKVSKEMFTLLMDYLSGLEGVTRQRVQTEAASRALRYKEYEKKNASTADQPQTATAAQEQQQQKPPPDGNVGKQTPTTTDDADNNEQDDKERWNRLDEHEKRKEYKRARKVLDTLKGR